MAKDAKTKKATANSIETIVTARFANGVRTLKGVLVNLTPTHVVFKYQKPHSASWNETSILLSSVVYYSGKKGKIGELVYIDSNDIAKRTGAMEMLPNGFIQLTDEDRNGATRITTFNPAFASVVSTGLAAPDSSTGFVAKAKSAPKGEKKEKKAKKG